jgi:hypothetical protein
MYRGPLMGEVEGNFPHDPIRTFASLVRGMPTIVVMLAEKLMHYPSMTAIVLESRLASPDSPFSLVLIVGQPYGYFQPWNFDISTKYRRDTPRSQSKPAIANKLSWKGVQI